MNTWLKHILTFTAVFSTHLLIASVSSSTFHSGPTENDRLPQNVYVYDGEYRLHHTHVLAGRDRPSAIGELLVP